MRYFMLDRVTSFTSGKEARGIKNVTISEDVLQDHFPDYPVFPGALIIEAMAQLAGFLIEMSLNTPTSIRRALLVQVDGAKFKRLTEPGDQLELTATIAESLDDAVRVSTSASVAGQKSASATLTFYLKEIDLERIHEQRRRLYRIWTRNIQDMPEII